MEQVPYSAETVAIEAIVEGYAFTTTYRNCDELRAEIDRCSEELSSHDARHSALVKSLLPVEQEYRNRICAQHAVLQQSLVSRLMGLKEELGRAEFDNSCLAAGYRRIDMSFMSKRKLSEKFQCELPLFAMFTTSDSRCSLMARAERESTCVSESRSSVPFIFGKLQAEVGAILARRASDSLDWQRERQVTISAKFAGAIPDDVRYKIPAAQAVFPEIFIVTEAPEWEIETFETLYRDEYSWNELKPLSTPEGGALLVGKRGDNFWLIAVFRLT